MTEKRNRGPTRGAELKTPGAENAPPGAWVVVPSLWQELDTATTLVVEVFAENFPFASNAKLLDAGYTAPERGNNINMLAIWLMWLVDDYPLILYGYGHRSVEVPDWHVRHDELLSVERY